VFFNGGAAQQLFRRHLRGAIERDHPRLCFVRLPSSSPANASWSRERKLAALLDAIYRECCGAPIAALFSYAAADCIDVARTRVTLPFAMRRAPVYPGPAVETG
jgi:hypothetical protein